MSASLKQKPILYSFFVSSCAWRVRNALAYKGIDYEYRAINLLDNEHESKEYQKLNPMSQVPALVIDGRTLTQSLSILEFIEEKYPEMPLLPKDTYERAKVREISELIGSGIQPMQNVGVATKQAAMDEKEWSHFFNRKGLIAVERILSETSGKFCVNNSVSLADCCLVPQVFAAQVRFDVDLTEFPYISRVYDNLSELDSFRAAHAFRQPDAPNRG